MVKKLLFILLLYPSVLFGQTYYYIATTGSDATGDGSIETPWKSLSYACSQVNGGIIMVNPGTYTETAQSVLAINTTIRGIATPHINSTYNGGYNVPLIKAETTYGWLRGYGNQTIEGIAFNGGLITSIAVQVNFRSGFKIINCSFTDFVYRGVVFYGMAEASWSTTSIFESDRTMPNYWTTGNEVSGCTFYNCSANESGGSVTIGQQDGISIHDCTITVIKRANATLGRGINFVGDGYCKNTDIYNNHVTLPDCPSGEFNFVVEYWYGLGGDKIHDNVFQGRVDIDVCYKGSSTYALEIYNNTIGFATQQDNTEYGISLEANCSDVVIRNNIIKNVSNAISFARIWPIGDHLQNNTTTRVWIYNNLMYGIGINSGGWTYGSVAGIIDPGYDTGDQTSYIYVWNNTIVASGNHSTGTYISVGIQLPTGCQTSYYYIRNNIIVGFNTGYIYAGPIWGDQPTTNSYVTITNNCFYNNGNINAPLFTNSYIPGSGYSYTNNLISNPDYDSEYKIDSTSATWRTGYWVGLNTDLAGAYWANPPSMGCYEYLTDYEPPAPPEVLPSGLLKIGNRFIIYKNRLLKLR